MEFHEFGGMPSAVFDPIIDFLENGTYPESAEKNATLKNNWRTTRAAFSSLDGMLLKNDLIVVKKGESEGLLRELHKLSGHGHSENIVPLFSSRFSYGGQSNGSIKRDYLQIMSTCEICTKMTVKKPFLERKAKEWKEITLRAAVSKLRAFKISLSGISLNDVKKYNVELEEKHKKMPIARPGKSVPLEEYETFRKYFIDGTLPRNKSAFKVRCGQFMLDPEDDNLIRWEKREGQPVLICQEDVPDISSKIHVMLAHIFVPKMMRIASRSVYWYGMELSLRKVSASCDVCRKRGGTGANVKYCLPPDFKDQYLGVSSEVSDGIRSINLDWGTIKKEKVLSYNKILENYVNNRLSGNLFKLKSGKKDKFCESVSLEDNDSLLLTIKQEDPEDVSVLEEKSRKRKHSDDDETEDVVSAPLFSSFLVDLDEIKFEVKEELVE